MQPGDVVHFSDYVIPPPGSTARLSVYPPWLAEIHEIQPGSYMVLNFGRLSPDHGAHYQRYRIAWDSALEPGVHQGWKLWPRVRAVTPGEVPLLDWYPEHRAEIVAAWNRSFAEESEADDFMRLSLHLHQVHGIAPSTASLAEVLALARRHYATTAPHGNFERITAKSAGKFAVPVSLLVWQTGRD